MKKIFYAALIGTAIITGGCVNTVSDTHQASIWPVGKDQVPARYERTIEQVYQAAFAVMSKDGVVVKEYIPHDTSNGVRSLEGKVNECNVWIRVASDDDPKTTSVVVQVLTKWGVSNVDLASQLQTEIALQLQSSSGS